MTAINRCSDCRHWDRKEPPKFNSGKRNWNSRERRCRRWENFYTRPDYVCRVAQAKGRKNDRPDKAIFPVQ